MDSPRKNSLKAHGYTFIHCFWVSGRYKRQGLGTRLLDECIKDSGEKNGIVCVTSKKVMPFLTDKGFFLKKEFIKLVQEKMV